MSKKKLPPKFVKAPEGMLDSPLRPTGEAAIAAPADGFTHAVAARFSPEVGEALVVAAKAEGLTLDGLLRKVVADWLAQRATRVEPVSAADAEVVNDARPRGLLEAVVTGTASASPGIIFGAPWRTNHTPERPVVRTEQT